MFKKGLALLTAVLMTASAPSAFAAFTYNQNASDGEIWISDDFNDSTESRSNWQITEGNNPSTTTFEDGKAKMTSASSFNRLNLLNHTLPRVGSSYTADSYTIEFDMEIAYTDNADSAYTIETNYSPNQGNGSNFHQILFKKSGVTVYERNRSWSNTFKGSNPAMCTQNGAYHVVLIYNRDDHTLTINADGQTLVAPLTNYEGNNENIGRSDGEKFNSYARYADCTIDNFTVRKGAYPTITDINASSIIETKNGAKEGTIRFAYQVNGYGATSAGACVLPVSIFNDSAVTANVNINTAVADGETFGADLTKIPEAYFDTAICSKPFITAGEETIWGESVMQSSVNNALNTNAN